MENLKVTSYFLAGAAGAAAGATVEASEKDQSLDMQNTPDQRIQTTIIY